jgi:UDP-N-acetylmuramyl pentapeptide phosphotransferase/UDP-N-acetylglucosamine-1-phosphate transferase
VTFWHKLVIGGCLSGLAAWCLTLALRWWSPRLGFMDVPNMRSSHAKATARAGGLAFVIVAAVAWILMFGWAGIPVPRGAGRIYVVGLVVAALGLADDHHGLPAWLKLAVHLLGAIAVVAGGTVLTQIALPGGWAVATGWLAYPLTVIWIVGLTNAYNFMDGIDGLAGGQAIVTVVTVVWVAGSRSDRAMILAAVMLGAGVLGFLVHNWPPAKIFMGDVGSIFLGFTFAAGALLPSHGVSDKPLPFLPWVAVMAPFLLDTGTTLTGRLALGEPWHEAHRQHLYQRLVDRGWTHLAVTSLYLAIALGCGLAAASAYGRPSP